MCRDCGSTRLTAPEHGPLCVTCRISGGTGLDPGPAAEQLTPTPLNPVWAWTDPAGRQALASGEVGAILRAYRVANGLSQEKLAERLGYDKTYISMIETGRRVVQDVATRRHIARTLTLPPHLLGVTDPADTEFVAMLAFAESTIRLADLARAGGHAAEAVNELWPMVARLEARAEEGHLERASLAVLGRAWISLGVCLGTVLPEERLWVAAAWTGKGLAATEHVGAEHPSGLLPLALAMHGNELRKGGQASAALTVLDRAVSTARHAEERGAALALLARAAGATGNLGLFEQTCRDALTLLETPEAAGPLSTPFTWREIQLRALLDLKQPGAAIALAETSSPTTAPSPQWEVIEQITVADVHLAAGDQDDADALLLPAIDAACRHRLPHQIQRIARIAERTGNHHLAQRAATGLNAVCSHRILNAGDHPNR